MLTLALALAALPGASHAEVFKCTSAQGKVEYADTPCRNAVPTGIENTPAPATGGDPNVKALGVYVQDAIAKKDYARATALAATPEHFAWIEAARAADAKLAGEERDRALRAETLEEIRRSNEINRQNSERIDELSAERYWQPRFPPHRPPQRPPRRCSDMVNGKPVYRPCR